MTLQTVTYDMLDGDPIIEKFGVDDETKEWVRVVGDSEEERRPATPEELQHWGSAVSATDLVALADQLAAQQAQLNAQAEAIDFLILDSLES